MSIWQQNFHVEKENCQIGKLMSVESIVTCEINGFNSSEQTEWKAKEQKEDQENNG